MDETANVPAIILVVIVAGSVISFLIAEDCWKRRQDEARSRQHDEEVQLARQRELQEQQDELRRQQEADPYSALSLARRRQETIDAKAKAEQERRALEKQRAEAEEQQRRTTYESQLKQRMRSWFNGIADALPQRMMEVADSGLNDYKIVIYRYRVYNTQRKQYDVSDADFARWTIDYGWHIDHLAADIPEYQHIVAVCRTHDYDMSLTNDGSALCLRFWFQF